MKNKFEKMLGLVLILLFCSLGQFTAQAQEGTGEQRFLDAGDILDTVTDYGGPTFSTRDFVPGTPWALFPADHMRAANLGRGKTFGFVQYDFTDTAGVHFDADAAYFNRPPGAIGKFIEKTARVEKPTIIVGGEDISSTSDADNFDLNINMDIIIHNRYCQHYGIEVEQWWYQWSDPAYDNFYIVDCRFEFTGDMDGDGKSDYDYDEMTQVYFAPNFFLATALGYEPFGDATKVWWRNYHTEPLHAWVGYVADDMRTSNKMEEGLINETLGIFEGADYNGFACLYADKSETERFDDGTQPINAFSPFNAETYPVGLDASQVLPLLTTVGQYALNWEPIDNISERREKGMGSSMFNFMTFGPYNLKKGDEPIRVVLAFAVDGEPWYDWDKSVKIVQDYLAGTIGDAEVKAYVRQSEQRVINTLVKAKEVFDNDLQLPGGQNPLPPSQVTVTPASGSVTVSWSSVSDAVSYKIYRATGSQETPVWYLINTIDGSTTSFEDTDVQLGFNYFYAITAVNAAGRESGINYTKSIKKEAIPFPATSKGVSSVRVVPNPFYFDPLGKENYTGEPDRIQFMGLTGRCTIRIFTLNGTLVATLENKNDLSGSIEWDQVTLHDQRIKSGVYIFQVEDDKGNSEQGKFVIVR